jgi:hypothetical protein
MRLVMWVRRGFALIAYQRLLLRPRFLLVLLALLLLGLAGAASAQAVSDYPTTVLNDSPVAYWRLGESSGTTFADSSGHGYNLTLSPPTSPSGTPGTYAVAGDVNPDDNAYQFNFDDGNLYQPAGSASRLDRDSNGLLLAPHMAATVSSGYPTGTNSYSLEAWVKPQSWNLSDTTTFPGQIVGDLAGVGCGGGNNGWQGTGLSYQDSPGNPEGAFVFARAGCTSFPDQTYSVPVAAGQWYHVVATYDGSTMRLFVDGTLVSRQLSESTSLGTSGALAQFQVGSGVSNVGFDSSGDHFKGTIDEAAVYSYALSGSQIQAHYA